MDRIASPNSPPETDKIVHRGNDVAAVDARVPTEVGLARGSVLVEGDEQAEVVAAHTVSGESVGEQPSATGLGTAQDPGGLVSHALEPGHLVATLALVGATNDTL